MAIVNYNLNDNGVWNLRAGIIKKAATDLYFLARDRMKNGYATKEDVDKEREICRFLRSPWGQQLSEDCGDYVIERTLMRAEDAVRRGKKK